MNKSRRETLPYLIEKLSILNIKRTNYIYSLLHGKEMIHGMPHEVLRKCGKKTCKCNTRIRRIDKEINQILVKLKIDTTTDYIPG